MRRAEQRQRELRERERTDDVRLVHVAQHVERVVGQVRLRARAEGAGVVHQQVEPADLLGGPHHFAPVAGVAHIAGNGEDPRPQPGQLGPGGLEGVRPPGVDHQRPSVGRE